MNTNNHELYLAVSGGDKPRRYLLDRAWLAWTSTSSIGTEAERCEPSRAEVQGSLPSSCTLYLQLSAFILAP